MNTQNKAFTCLRNQTRSYENKKTKKHIHIIGNEQQEFGDVRQKERKDKIKVGMRLILKRHTVSQVGKCFFLKKKKKALLLPD